MNDRDILIRTVIGEAANESPEGMAAVVHVVKNRARDPRWPNSLGAVALQPKQFSAWNEGAGGNDLVRKYGPGDPIYERVGAVVDQVMAGAVPDVTGGATHYYSPRGMQALVDEGAQGNLLPRWLQEENERRGGQTVTIGGHIFTGQANGQPGVTRSAGQVPVAAPLAAAGFTQEQIAQAFEGQAQRQQPEIAAPVAQDAPMMMAPAQEAAPLQAVDPLQAAMRKVQAHRQRRKGILPWL